MLLSTRRIKVSGRSSGPSPFRISNWPLLFGSARAQKNSVAGAFLFVLFGEADAGLGHAGAYFVGLVADDGDDVFGGRDVQSGANDLLSSVSPPASCKTFALFDFMRVPSPAASITTVTLFFISTIWLRCQCFLTDK